MKQSNWFPFSLKDWKRWHFDQCSIHTWRHVYGSPSCVFRAITIVLFSNFGPRCRDCFQNTTLLTYEFLETLASSKKTHFCSMFSKTKLKVWEDQPSSNIVFERGNGVVSHAYHFILNNYLFSPARKMIWNGREIRQSEFILNRCFDQFVHL